MVVKRSRVARAVCSKSSSVMRGMAARLLCAREMNRLPAVPRDVRAHTLERITMTSQILLGDELIEVVQNRPSVSYAEVSRGPHVVATECVHEIHLGRPLTDSAHGDDVHEDVVVTHSTVLSEVDATVERPCGQVQHGGSLGVRKSHAAQVDVARRGDRFGSDVSAAQVDHALVNGVGRLGGEQLKGNGLGPCWEWLRDGCAPAPRRRTDLVDQYCKGRLILRDRDRALSWCHRRDHVKASYTRLSRTPWLPGKLRTWG